MLVIGLLTEYGRTACDARPWKGLAAWGLVNALFGSEKAMGRRDVDC